MAKQVETESTQAADEDTQTFTAMTKSKLKTLLAKLRRSSANMDEARATMGGIVNAAVENDNYHKGAGAVIQRLDRMEATKRNEFLFNFDVYRDHMGWETSDLLQDRQPAAGEAEQAPRTARTKPINELTEADGATPQ